MEVGEMIATFFSELATRITKEPGVCDVLYAALLSSSELYSILADLLGLPGAPTGEIIREYAEYQSTAGRPDFLFRSDSDTPVLLEVKLFDRNYHYQEYCQIKVDDIQPRLVLLTAHRPSPPPPDGWTTIHWEAIIDKMEQHSDD